ncbi:leucyl/phenylalanyl-tRNA--protein transferase [Advenella kashmirensis WT001]|uniref:Leucyl/phenylalanyl-tRNA--protein transferase n=1 Tax=Advenella kashmirensis (strain DSM 17095 / LMG 22695 / WT001) TaxID=1036672 RepID=I3UES5_ADVKW|nr:leucyl/phenylalanyl-tRNA--protein transferase [Advenella kashmirensis]AFK63513.1 leucyl/phenylalanyl-tRNA--protein transferase [Advenella kashmirensis WT001]
MITLPCLDNGEPFPPACQALKEPDGLLAFGGDLSTSRLLQAYKLGIFPWYSADQPVLWWSPSARMVLRCDDFRISPSLGKLLKRVARNERQQDAAITVTTDTCFEAVMRACAAPRGAQAGTWITDEMIAAYTELHRQGYAHSIETWLDGQLAGGLYGIGIGRMFYGESMFSTSSNTSKIALAWLVRFLKANQVTWIDCQQDTPHLASMGARPQPRAAFLRHVSETVNQPALLWPAGQMLGDGTIVPPM